jgi:hypothetical protein
MLAHYSHVRIEAKRKALEALDVGRTNCASSPMVRLAGLDTTNDTKLSEGVTTELQVLEKNGGDDETRTRDLCRDRAAF